MAYRIVVIGTSLGGLEALCVLLGALPGSFNLPIAIVQHRAAEDAGLARFLQAGSRLIVEEAQDKQPLHAGRVYLAPPDYHLLIEPGTCALSTEAPVWHARPAIDLLFETAAAAYGAATIGVVLTGASEDGARGLAQIHEGGGLALVQEPANAQCALMPSAALVAVPTARVLPLEAIAPALLELVLPTPSTGVEHSSPRTSRGPT